MRSVMDGRRKVVPDAEMERLLESGVSAYTWHDEEYPPRLKKSYDLRRSST